MTNARNAHRILVTGGAGYVGSILVRALLEQGHRVTVVDSFSWRTSTLMDCCAFPNFEVVRGDVRDERLMVPLIHAHDTIIPLAALVGSKICDIDPIAAESTMGGAMKALLEHAAPSQRIIYPATNSGYGIGKGDEPCTEESPLEPVSLYGRLKVYGEQLVLDHPNGLTLRLATVFGASPRMRRDLLVNDYVYRAVHEGAVVFFEGHRRRNFIHVRDVARAFLHGIEHFDAMKGRPYNVGLDDANLTRVQVCEAIKRQVPSFVYVESSNGEDLDTRDCIVSSARLAGTGFRPAWSLDQGIRELVKCFTILPRTLFANA